MCCPPPALPPGCGGVFRSLFVGRLLAGPLPPFSLRGPTPPFPHTHKSPLPQSPPNLREGALGFLPPNITANSLSPLSPRAALNFQPHYIIPHITCMEAHTHAPLQKQHMHRPAGGTPGAINPPTCYSINPNLLGLGSSGSLCPCAFGQIYTHPSKQSISS